MGEDENNVASVLSSMASSTLVDFGWSSMTFSESRIVRELLQEIKTFGPRILLERWKLQEGEKEDGRQASILCCWV